MQLTKLEIRGFKSFGDRAVINFNEGITGIVGPNGCGKSNVIDAIRWVLGEQKTKALRSDKMDNVIFNGTKNRRPTNLAEVSLTFKNTKNLLPTEYGTVTIGRRYYRTGESEYLLNGVSCRLKDITNLFLDTGISSNSYSIIELKMVDELLNDKENSRRGLFEEAAGVAKYRVRKKETMRKLKDADADLERVEDLLFEIEKNMRSLERQAKQAQRYFRLKEEYKQAGLELAKKQAEEKDKALRRLTEKTDAENDRLTIIGTQTAEKQAALEAMKTETLKKEKLLSSRQKTLNESMAKLGQLENEKKIRAEKQKLLESRLHDLQDGLTKRSQELADSDKDCQGLEMQQASMERMHLESERQLEQAKSEYERQKADVARLKDEIARIDAKREFLRKQVFEKQKNQELTAQRLSTAKQEAETLTVKLSGFSREREEASRIKSELERKSAGINDQVKALEESETLRKRDFAKTELSLREIEKEIAQAETALGALRAEIRVKTALTENLEGFPEAIRNIRKEKNYPLLSDLLICEEQIRPALESHLEPWLNYFVVETEAEAKASLTSLKQNGKGRAGFLVTELATPNPGEANKLLSHISCEEKYRPILAQLLAGFSISDSGPKSFSQDGSLWRSGCVLRGGSVSEDNSRLAATDELRKLKEQAEARETKLGQLREQQAELAETLEELKEDDLSEELTDFQRQASTLNSEKAVAIAKEERLDIDYEETLDAKENAEERIGKLEKELSATASAGNDDELEILEEERERLDESLHETSGAFELASEAFNKANLDFHRNENGLESLEKEMAFKRAAADTLRKSFAHDEQKIADTRTELDNLGDEESNNEAIENLRLECESVEKFVREAEKDYFGLRGEVDKTENEARELARERENAQALVMELQNAINESKLALQSVRERVKIEFATEWDDLMSRTENALENSFATMSETELEVAVKETKSKLEKIGAVNPMAMEAFEEIKQRFEFITGQKQDLENAKGSLMDTIDEIETVARNTFLDAFHQIKENFIKVFRTLFNKEDDCDLVLVDPSNPLESKIEIMAKPKGKRPQTINQLSGGEKTLTATSLLFAIYLLKPAPFCIFDEVDAPLDDANIDKFSKIIKEFSKDSQFIIVTHNKRTMASADVLYGVTILQEVSRVLPVDLRELEYKKELKQWNSGLSGK
ncbi:chromosome partition protein Smc [Fulvitalea axinellae]|uniref:Chromosome partition protein Smc n=1 Tax=Fulvitalea axinellae TaxID=1182444 RepID=A0AAU9D8T6_9BACT|nr:chromosome partition protein Smc [Fulvitalea axinellae]